MNHAAHLPCLVTYQVNLKKGVDPLAVFGRHPYTYLRAHYPIDASRDDKWIKEGETETIICNIYDTYKWAETEIEKQYKLRDIMGGPDHIWREYQQQREEIYQKGLKVNQEWHYAIVGCGPFADSAEKIGYSITESYTEEKMRKILTDALFVDILVTDSSEMGGPAVIHKKKQTKCFLDDPDLQIIEKPDPTKLDWLAILRGIPVGSIKYRYTDHECRSDVRDIIEIDGEESWLSVDSLLGNPDKDTHGDIDKEKLVSLYLSNQK